MLLPPFAYSSRPPSSLHITTIISTSALSVGDALRVLDTQKVSPHRLRSPLRLWRGLSFPPSSLAGHQIRLHPPLGRRSLKLQSSGGRRCSQGEEKDLKERHHDDGRQGGRAWNETQVTASFPFVPFSLLSPQCVSDLMKTDQLQSLFAFFFTPPDPSPLPLSSPSLPRPKTSFSTTSPSEPGQGRSDSIYPAISSTPSGEKKRLSSGTTSSTVGSTSALWT